VENITKWKFEPSGHVIEFDIHYEFVLGTELNPETRMECLQPLHIRIVSPLGRLQV
jgi:hypothetical protein